MKTPLLRNGQFLPLSPLEMSCLCLALKFPAGISTQGQEMFIVLIQSLAVPCPGTWGPAHPAARTQGMSQGGEEGEGGGS